MENYCVNGRGGYFQQQPHAKLGESSDSPSNTLNQSKIMLQHLAPTTAIETIGTLAEIVGPNGKVFISPTNFAGDKRIFLDLKTAEGQEGRIFCSPAVSKHLREKTMKASQLFGMPVALITRVDGTQGYTVTLPGSQLVELAVPTEIEAWSQTLPLEELVDL